MGLARQACPAPSLVQDGMLAAAEEVGPLASGRSARFGIGRARLSLSWTSQAVARVKETMRKKMYVKKRQGTLQWRRI